jgi:hypothetical protein
MRKPRFERMPQQEPSKQHPLLKLVRKLREPDEHTDWIAGTADARTSQAHKHPFLKLILLKESKAECKLGRRVILKSEEHRLSMAAFGMCKTGQLNSGRCTSFMQVLDCCMESGSKRYHFEGPGTRCNRRRPNLATEGVEGRAPSAAEE